MSNITINGLPHAATIDGVNDYIPIYTASLTATQGINRNTLLGLASGPVGLTDVQAVTNKTLGNTNTVTLKDTLFTLQDDSDTTKQARFQLSGLTTATTRTYTLPDVTDTIVSLTASQTLTNKTLTSPTITSPTITNATISTDSITGFTSTNNGTLFGITITGSAIQSSTAFADGVVVPKVLQTGTGSSWGWQSFTSTAVNFTLGNGTMTGRYMQTGKMVDFELYIKLGSTSSMGTAPNLTLPVAANARYDVATFPNLITIGYFNNYDVSANTSYQGFLALLSLNTFMPLPLRTDSTWLSNPGNTFSAIQPAAAYATGDLLWFKGTYEAA